MVRYAGFHVNNSLNTHGDVWSRYASNAATVSEKRRSRVIDWRIEERLGRVVWLRLVTGGEEKFPDSTERRGRRAF